MNKKELRRLLENLFYIDPLQDSDPIGVVWNERDIPHCYWCLVSSDFSTGTEIITHQEDCPLEELRRFYERL